MSFHAKITNLKQILRNLGRVVVAYSGGLDSAFLAKVAHDVLGEGALAVTGVSESVPEREMEAAKAFAGRHGIPHELIRTEELDNPAFACNPKNRCYHCKSELFGRLTKLAKARGFDYVLDGTNADDRGDYRPGRKAAEEKGVRSPLLEAGFTKEDLRTAAREMNLEVWDKPSFACLGSRFPYGETMTKEKFAQLEKCENILRDLGFRQFRVRYHGETARIEVGAEDMEKILQEREAIVPGFRETGFQFVALDLEGYRTGSMNRGIEGQGEGKTKSEGPKERAEQVDEEPSGPRPAASNPERKKKQPKWMASWKPKTFGEGWATLYTDGGSHGNPGPASIGYVLYDSDGKELKRRGARIGEATNNQAEYQALLEGLTAARKLGIEKIVVLADSQLVVRQITGAYKIKNADLLGLAVKVQKIRREFLDFQIRDIRREENKMADHLAQSVFEEKK